VADVSNAYQFLNESLQLGLPDDQLALVEAQFRESFAERRGYKIEVGGSEFHENWEFIASLEPRTTALDRTPFTREELQAGRRAPDDADGG